MPVRRIGTWKDALRRRMDAVIAGALPGGVKIVAAHSVETAKGWTRPVAAVFLDGNHGLEAVEADVAAWLPHLVPGGFLLLHDAAGAGAFAGPRDVAARILVDRTQFDADGRVGSLRWGRRVGGTSAWLPGVAGAGLVDAVLEKTKRPRG